MRIKEITKSRYHVDTLTITWKVTMCCNYRCSYCIQGKDKHNTALPDFQFLEETANNLEALIKRSPFTRANLIFIGGEVSLIKQLPDLVKLLPSVTEFGITTNLSAPIQWYNSFPNLNLTASYHEEFIKLDNFLKKFEQIEAQTKRVEFVRNSKNAATVDAALAICDTKGIQYKVDADRKEPGNISSSTGLTKNNEDLTRVLTTDNELVTYKNTFEIFNEPSAFEEACGYRLNTKGFACNLGYNELHIDPNGLILGYNGECRSRIKLEDWTPKVSLCKDNSCSLCYPSHLYRIF